MSYQVLQDTISIKIKTLGNQLEDWVKKLNLKNIFELSHFPFEDCKERAIVHGLIQRRDAYVDIGNMIELEQTSLSVALKDSKTGVITSVEAMKIVSNAFSREIEDKMLTEWISNPRFVKNIVANKTTSEDDLKTCIEEGGYEQAIPYLAVLWYNKFREAVIPAQPIVEPTPEPEKA
jgi:hypothetical protein